MPPRGYTRGEIGGDRTGASAGGDERGDGDGVGRHAALLQRLRARSRRRRRGAPSSRARPRRRARSPGRSRRWRASLWPGTAARCASWCRRAAARYSRRRVALMSRRRPTAAAVQAACRSSAQAARSQGGCAWRRAKSWSTAAARYGRSWHLPRYARSRLCDVRLFPRGSARTERELSHRFDTRTSSVNRARVMLTVFHHPLTRARLPPAITACFLLNVRLAGTWWRSRPRSACCAR